MTKNPSRKAKAGKYSPDTSNVVSATDYTGLYAKPASNEAEAEAYAALLDLPDSERGKGPANES